MIHLVNIVIRLVCWILVLAELVQCANVLKQVATWSCSCRRSSALSTGKLLLMITFNANGLFLIFYF